MNEYIRKRIIKHFPNFDFKKKRKSIEMYDLFKILDKLDERDRKRKEIDCKKEIGVN